eukprot:3595036-Amphidinium_carterae.1
MASLGQLELDPVREHLRLTRAARRGTVPLLPLEGWLQRGAWASWAHALTILSTIISLPLSGAEWRRA